MIEPELGFGTQIVAEFDALLLISPLGLGLWLAFVLALASLFAWAGPAAVHFAWRIGADQRRRLGLAASAMRVVGLIIGFAGVLRPVFMRAPTLGMLILVVVLALAAGIAPTQLRNLASGLSLSTRTRLREGDLVCVGPHEGIVRDIGLLRVGLRTSEGGVTHVPAADFDKLAVTVGSRRAAAPVVARVLAHPEFGDKELELLRHALWLCVYRRAGSELHLDYNPHTRALEVRMDTWAQTAVAEAERHLRAILIRHAGPRSSARRST